MKKSAVALIIVLICAAAVLVFAGISFFAQPDAGEEEKPQYPYPISFLIIEPQTNPDTAIPVITLTEADSTKYPVLIGALENGDTYLNIHPDGNMTADEYYAIQDFNGAYISFDGVIYRVALGPIGLAPPLP